MVTSDDHFDGHCCVDGAPFGVGKTEPVINSGLVSSPPAGYRFPREVIAVAVRWYLRYGLSYRDVEELLSERGIEVDHVTVYRWVQTFTPEFVDAARPCRHAAGNRWFVDETYVKVAGRWTYLYRAVDQHGQVIDVLLSKRRDAAAARDFFARALRFISRNSSHQLATSPTGTPTTAWRLITVNSKRGCDRCADSNK
jgi:transposase-like protein